MFLTVLWNARWFCVTYSRKTQGTSIHHCPSSRFSLRLARVSVEDTGPSASHDMCAAEIWFRLMFCHHTYNIKKIGKRLTTFKITVSISEGLTCLYFTKKQDVIYHLDESNKTKKWVCSKRDLFFKYYLRLLLFLCANRYQFRVPILLHSGFFFFYLYP